MTTEALHWMAASAERGDIREVRSKKLEVRRRIRNTKLEIRGKKLEVRDKINLVGLPVFKEAIEHLSNFIIVFR